MSDRRFWCENHKEMRTLIAGRKIKFINHEYSTSDPVIIAGLEKLAEVEDYEEAMKKKMVKVDKTTMTKIEAEVKEEMKKKIYEEEKVKMEKELRKEIEKELRVKIEEELRLEFEKKTKK